MDNWGFHDIRALSIFFTITEPLILFSYKIMMLKYGSKIASTLNRKAF